MSNRVMLLAISSMLILCLAGCAGGGETQQATQPAAQAPPPKPAEPPVELYEPIAPSAEWDALKRIENMTNPRLRQNAGILEALIPEDRGIEQNTACTSSRCARWSTSFLQLAMGAKGTPANTATTAFGLSRLAYLQIAWVDGQMYVRCRPRNEKRKPSLHHRFNA